MRREIIEETSDDTAILKKFKVSKYNHFLYLEDEDLYMVYNAISNALGKMPPFAYNCLKEGAGGIVRLQKDKSNESLLKGLHSGHVIIDEDFDELEFQKTKLNINRFGQQILSLTIATTLDCNFGCVYCYQGDNLQKYPGETQEEDIFNFIKQQMAQFGYQGIQITWFGGEPLLNKKLVFSLSQKIIRYCKSRDISYNSSVVTNGTILNNDIARRLKRLNVNYIQITIDGPKEIHDKRRPFKNSQRSSFDVIIKNIERVYGIVHIQVRINVDKTNYEKAIDLLDYFQEKGFLNESTLFSVYVGFTREWTSNCNNIASDCFTTREFSNAEFEFQKILMEKGYSNASYPSPFKNYCTATSPHGFVIDPSGALHKCWSDVGNKDAYLGHVRNPIALNKKLLQWLSYDAITKISECKECSFFPICGGGCPYVHIKQPEKLEKDSEYNCTAWKLLLEEKMRLFLKQKANELK